ncbi:MAG: hypothetical protein ACM30G_15285 [Micromonosporaceae bacterium]
MGVKIRGLDELIRDLQRVEPEGEKRWPKVVSRGAVNIKTAWRKRWKDISPDPGRHAPHLARGVGYDTHSTKTRHTAVIGVSPLNPQAPLAFFAEYGSVRNAPYPGGLPSLLEEEPRFLDAVADLAVELLEGR